MEAVEDGASPSSLSSGRFFKEQHLASQVTGSYHLQFTAIVLDLA